jgi:hypothetical protein
MREFKQTNQENPQKTDLLAALLEGHTGEVDLAALASDNDQQELSDLVAVAEWVKLTPRIEPPDEFRMQSRQRVLERLSSPQSVTFWQRVRHIYTEALRSMQIRQRTALIIMSILMLIAMLSVGGTQIVLASSDDLPGDSLYSIKLFVEQARLMAATPEEKVNQLDELMQIRLVEITELINQGRYEDLQVAISGFNFSINQMSDTLESLPPQSHQLYADRQLVLETAHLNRIRVLSSLLGKVPENARQSIEKTIQNSKPYRPQEKQEKPADTITPSPTIKKTTDKPEDPGNSNIGKPTKENVSENKPDPTVTIAPTKTVKPTNIPPGQVNKDKPEKDKEKDKQDKNK